MLYLYLCRMEGSADRFGIGLNLDSGVRVRFLAKLEDLIDARIKRIDGVVNLLRTVAWEGECMLHFI